MFRPDLVVAAVGSYYFGEEWVYPGVARFFEEHGSAVTFAALDWFLFENLPRWSFNLGADWAVSSIALIGTDREQGETRVCTYSQDEQYGSFQTADRTGEGIAMGAGEDGDALLATEIAEGRFFGDVPAAMSRIIEQVSFANADVGGETFTHRVGRSAEAIAQPLVQTHLAQPFNDADSLARLDAMPTDAERWRFLADHTLTLHTDGGSYGYMVHWCKTAGPGEPPKFFPVSNGVTADEAIDNAIARWERKHRPENTAKQRPC